MAAMGRQWTLDYRHDYGHGNGNQGSRKAKRNEPCSSASIASLNPIVDPFQGELHQAAEHVHECVLAKRLMSAMGRNQTFA